MKQNIGKRERIVRPLIAVALLFLAVTHVQSTLLQAALMTCALFLLLNGLLGRCYLWKVLGIDRVTTVGPPCRQKTQSTSRCVIND